MIQATEAVKLILGKGQPLVNRLLMYDALGMRFRELKVRRDPTCPVCGENPTIREVVDSSQLAAAAAGDGEGSQQPAQS